jgi:thioredoxin-related protein
MSKFKFLLILITACFIQLTAVAQPIEWVSLEEAQTKASQQGKKVLIYAEAEWCGYCKKMNQKVFPRETVADSLQKYFLPVRIDIESNAKTVLNGEELTEQMLARKFRVTGTPTMIFLDSEGKVLGTQPGFLRADVFDKLLAYVGADLYNEFEFKDYLEKNGVVVNK